MTNFYERQLQRMFGDSEVLSADTVFAGKAMVSKISDDLRAKIEFVTARVSGQYEGLKLSIINKNEGLIDSQTFMFHEIIGLKGAARDRKPHIWDDNGKASWFGYEPTATEFENIASKVEDYVEMYADQEMRYEGVKLFQSLENGQDLTTQEVRYSLKLLESLPLSDLNIFCLKTFPDCYRMTKGGRIRPSSARYRNWGTMQHGKILTARISVFRKTESACSLSDILEKDVPEKYYLSPTQTLKILIRLLRDVKASEYTLQTVSPSQSQATQVDSQVTPASILKLTVKVKSGILLSWEGEASYFIDLNFPPNITPDARCITARHDSGVSNRKGEHSGVLELTDLPTEEPDPMPIITPDREVVRQQGLRVKAPNEAMFTLTVTDVQGVIEKGCRIRKLMPIECWRLQGFTDEQFRRAEATGLKDGRLYKMAGNAVSVPVITALGDFIKELENEEQQRSEN